MEELELTCSFDGIVPVTSHAVTGDNTSVHCFTSDDGKTSRSDDFAGMVAIIFLTSPDVTA